MKHFLSLVVFAALSVVSCGCVDGKLHPLVAPIAAALDVAACSIVDVAVENKIVGSVCAGAVPLINGILSGLSAPRLPLLRAPSSPVERVPVHYKGKTIGHFDPVIAPEVQAKLDAMSAE